MFNTLLHHTSCVHFTWNTSLYRKEERSHRSVKVRCTVIAIGHETSKIISILTDWWTIGHDLNVATVGLLSGLEIPNNRIHLYAHVVYYCHDEFSYHEFHTQVFVVWHRRPKILRVRVRVRTSAIEAIDQLERLLPPFSGNFDSDCRIAYWVLYFKCSTKKHGLNQSKVREKSWWIVSYRTTLAWAMSVAIKSFISIYPH